MHSHKNTPQARKPPFTVFLALTIFIFFCSLSVADSIGFVPYYIDGSSPASTGESDPQTTTSTDSSVPLSALPQLGDTRASTVLPTHISIPSAAIDLPVQNPNTRDINTLDALLQSGPARYVDSAKLGGPGNVLIFAHSSHLPIVRNQMFKAFNNIPDLQAGELITITGSDGKSYLYSVTSVRKANATDATIDLSPSAGTKLTLVTCDTLTGKSARFILEADFVGVTN